MDDPHHSRSEIWNLLKLIGRLLYDILRIGPGHFFN
jgi:hypothetical protein